MSRVTVGSWKSNCRSCHRPDYPSCNTGSAASPLIAGALYEANFDYTFYYTAGLFALATLILLLIPMPRIQEGTEPGDNGPSNHDPQGGMQPGSHHAHDEADEGYRHSGQG